MSLPGSRFMCGATSKLRGPLAQTGLDVSERPVPVYPGSARRGFAVVDPLLVTKGGQGFDVTVVKKPATRDHVMIEVKEARRESFNPGAQWGPFPGGFVRREIGPMDRSGDLVEVEYPIGLE